MFHPLHYCIKYICLLFILIHFSLDSLAQKSFLEQCIDGEWVLFSNYYSYDGAGTGTSKYLDNFKEFKIIAFDVEKGTYKIRENNEVYEGNFRLEVNTAGKEETVFIRLTFGLDSQEEFDYLRLMPTLNLVSSGYAPGLCTDWDTYVKLGKGFFEMKLNSKNKRLVKQLVKRKEEKSWHKKPLKKEKNIQNNS